MIVESLLINREFSTANLTANSDPHTELDNLISTELDNCLISTELDSEISTQLDNCQISTQLDKMNFT